MNIQELRQKRAALIAQARAILDGANGAALSAEDDARYNALFTEADQVAETVRRYERQEQAERELGDVTTRAEKPNGQSGSTRQATTPRETEEYRAAFDRYLRSGLQGLTNAEHRALQSDLDVSGGYLVTPTQFVNDLLKAVDNAVYIRQWATTYRVPTAQSLGVPTLENDPADPTWTSELGTGDEDSTMSFGRRELHPQNLAKRIKVSNKLVRQVSSAEGLVRARLAYKFAVTMEANYMTGTGAGQPLGLFTASADGITTARDVATDNAATYPTFNGLISAKYALKQQYWPMAKWLFHRDTVKTLAKLVDGNGQYIWRDGVQAGEPDRLLGLPVYMSEYAPNTLTANQYVGVLGDFSYYWIADALDMQVQRLVELYAATNQIGMIGRMESDGQPVLAEAFVRVKLGS